MAASTAATTPNPTTTSTPKDIHTNTTPTISSSNLRTITLPLIRKRSEHNENLVSTLEELALHQEELQAIGPTLGRICGKTLRILLLQNNVIDRMDPKDLRHFCSLEYLNLALNNIRVVEGIEHLESLEKLDLTLNFVDLDALRQSMDCLEGIETLKELYMTGNPCASNSNEHDAIGRGWKQFRSYVICRLPQLESLDGVPILRSDRIKAMQIKVDLENELDVLAETCRINKMRIQQERCKDDGHVDDKDSFLGEDQVTTHCPEDRTKMSNEMAQQRAEKEERETANQPKFRGEKDFEMEQKEAIERSKAREAQMEEGRIYQCNEGKWKFQFDEETKPKYLLLDIAIPRFLSSSLIDLDVHPTYVTVIIKGKTLRLVLPTEVNAEKSTAQRSTTTGHLLVSMPKIDSSSHVLQSKESNTATTKNSVIGQSKQKITKRSGLGTEMLNVALKGSVRVDNIVKRDRDNDDQQAQSLTLDMKESKTVIKNPGMKVAFQSKEEDSDSDEEPPPLL